jgi:hypothetical protein
MIARGGPFARTHSVSELGVPCDRAAGIPAGANVTSVRNAPSLFGTGRIQAISEAAIRAGAEQPRDGVSGRPNLVRGPDGRGRVGRFGWKGGDADARRELGARDAHSGAKPARPSVSSGRRLPEDVDGLPVALRRPAHAVDELQRGLTRARDEAPSLGVQRLNGERATPVATRSSADRIGSATGSSGVIVLEVWMPASGRLRWPRAGPDYRGSAARTPCARCRSPSSRSY